MQQSERIRTLSLLMIPLNDRACIFEDEFIMADSFDRVESRPKHTPYFLKNRPEPHTKVLLGRKSAGQASNYGLNATPIYISF